MFLSPKKIKKIKETAKEIENEYIEFLKEKKKIDLTPEEKAEFFLKVLKKHWKDGAIIYLKSFIDFSDTLDKIKETAEEVKKAANEKEKEKIKEVLKKQIPKIMAQAIKDSSEHYFGQIIKPVKNSLTIMTFVGYMNKPVLPEERIKQAIERNISEFQKEQIKFNRQLNDKAKKELTELYGILLTIKKRKEPEFEKKYERLKKIFGGLLKEFGINDSYDHNLEDTLVYLKKGRKILDKSIKEYPLYTDNSKPTEELINDFFKKTNELIQKTHDKRKIVIKINPKSEPINNKDKKKKNDIKNIG